jgi:hypothetical protein
VDAQETFASLLLTIRIEHHPGDNLGSILLHGRNRVTIDVESYGDAGVTEALLHHFWMDTSAQRQCGPCVSQVVEPDPRKVGARNASVEVPTRYVALEVSRHADHGLGGTVDNTGRRGRTDSECSAPVRGRSRRGG